MLVPAWSTLFPTAGALSPLWGEWATKQLTVPELSSLISLPGSISPPFSEQELFCLAPSYLPRVAYSKHSVSVVWYVSFGREGIRSGIAPVPKTPKDPELPPILTCLQGQTWDHGRAGAYSQLIGLLQGRSLRERRPLFQSRIYP